MSWWDAPNQAQRASPSRGPAANGNPHGAHVPRRNGSWGRGHGGACMAMGEPWDCAAPTNRRGGCRCDLFQPSSLSRSRSPLPLRVRCAALLLLLRSVRALQVSVPPPRRFSPVRTGTPAPGPRFLVPDCLNYSLSPPLRALCFLLSAFAVLVCRSPFRSVGRAVSLCVLSGGCRRLCCSVLLSAVVVWLASGCLSGEGSGAVLSPVREEFVASQRPSLARFPSSIGRSCRRRILRVRHVRCFVGAEWELSSFERLGV